MHGWRMGYIAYPNHDGQNSVGDFFVRCGQCTFGPGQSCALLLKGERSDTVRQQCGQSSTWLCRLQRLL